MMKNQMLHFLVLFSLSFFLVLSCNEDDQSYWRGDDSATEVNDFQTRPGDVVTILPTGDNDTDNLENALKNADPGTVVQLTEGTYYIEPLFLEDFRGILRGAGKTLTVIEPYGDMEFLNIDPNNYPTADTKWPFLITFRRGDIQVTDLTIRVPEGTIAYWDFYGEDVYDLLGAVLVTGETVSSHFENIALQGGPGHNNTYNPFNGLVIMSHYGGVTGASGTHIVRSSDFNSTDYPVDFGYMRDANVQIGGSDAYGNTFSNVGVGVNSMNVIRSQVNISHNTIQFPYAAGIRLRQGTMNMSNPLTSYLVEKNDIITSGFVDGTVFVDFGILNFGQKAMDILYRYNNIHMQNAYWGGLWAIGLQEARIESNRVWGQGDYGLFFNAAFGNEILNNNLISADVNAAHVVLWSQTADNVVSGGATGTIWDLGSNNTTSRAAETTSGSESLPYLQREMPSEQETIFDRNL